LRKLCGPLLEYNASSPAGSGLKAEANHGGVTQIRPSFAKRGGLRRSEVPEKSPASWRGFFFYLVAPGWTVLFVPPVLLLVPAALPGAKTPVLVLPIELAAPIAFPVVP
jgi:hypothetical protein